MKKRILSVLLAIVMVVGLMPAMSVSATAVDDHTHCICGKKPHADVGDHTTAQNVTWETWCDPEDLSPGTYYLYLTGTVSRNDFSNSTSDCTIPSGVTLYLCLNSCEFYGTFVVESGANLILCDCGGNGVINAGPDNRGNNAQRKGVGVKLKANSDGSTNSFSMYGGTIQTADSISSNTGNPDENGGGVQLNAGSTFNMYGGTITRCVAPKGSAVYVADNSTFNMYGGTIRACFTYGDRLPGNSNQNGYAHNFGYGAITVCANAEVNFSGNLTITGNKTHQVAGTSANRDGPDIVLLSGDDFTDPIAKFSVAKGTVFNGGETQVRVGVENLYSKTEGAKDLENAVFAVTDKDDRDAQMSRFVLQNSYAKIIPHGNTGLAASLVSTISWSPSQNGSFSVKVDDITLESGDTVDRGKTVTIRTEPSRGYEVDKVTYTPTGGAETPLAVVNRAYSFTMPAESVTVNVTFKVKPPTYFNVSLHDTNGVSTGGKYNVNKTTAEYNDRINITIIPDPNYEIDTVTAVKTSTSETITMRYDANVGCYFFIMPYSGAIVAVTFKASAAPATYNVALHDTNGATTGGEYDVDKTSATENEKVTITVNPDEGYEVDKVTYKPAGGSVTTVTAVEGVYSFTMPAEAVTVSATFKLKTYSITATANPAEGGTVSDLAAGGNYTHGDIVTLTVTANKGYNFVNWTKNGTEVSTDATYTFTATENAEYVANFEVNSYTIAVAPATNGSVTVDKSTAVAGTTVTITATPAEGYVVDAVTVKKDASNIDVTVTDNGNGTYSFTMPASDVTVSATFKPAAYNVTLYDTDGETTGGSYTVDKSTATEGETVTITATPAEGYEVDTVAVYKTDEENTTVAVDGGKFTMPAYPVTVSVTFREIVYTGTVSEEDGTVENVTADGLGEVAEEINKNIVLTVKVEAADANDTEQTAIKGAAGSRTLEFIDITLKDNSGNPVEVPQGTVLEIEIPFTVGNKRNITVYRHHDGSAAAFTSLNARAADDARTDGTFYVDSMNNKIYIYTNKFSTYAIGYSEPAPYSPPIYSITAVDGENGKITVSSKWAYFSSTVTITVKPDAGYQLGTLAVTDTRGNEIALRAKDDGTYTFMMPSRNVKVKATFVSDGSYTTCPGDSTCPMYGYTDLDCEAWYHDGVHYAIEKGLMSGYGNGIFKPNADTTRAMITVMLWRLNGSPVVNYLLDFEDVAEGQWYTEAIRWAKSEGIAGGYGNGYFGTNDAITREQMVTILWRYAKYKGADVSVGEDTNILSYNDASDVAEYAIPAMQWACGSGMVQGTNDPNGEGMILDPESNAVRAQAATLMQRFCENILK